MKNTLPLLEIENKMADQSASIALSSKSGNDSASRIILETCLTIMAREIRVLSGKPVQVSLCSPYYQSHYPAGWQEKDLRLFLNGQF